MTETITPKMIEFAANLQLNSTLQTIDKALRDEFPDRPETQMGVLMMAQALAFARVRRKHRITGGARKRVLDKALADFADKIKKFGYEDKPEVTG